MTAAIVWTVLWFVFIGIGTVLFQVAGVAAAFDKFWLVFVGWGVAVLWAVFALIQFVLQLVATIQLGIG